MSAIRMMRLLRAATPVAVLLLVAGCRVSDPVRGVIGPCEGPVQLSLEFRQTFEIHWSPRCGVAQLSVESPPGSGSSAGWVITSPSFSILPPVRFGEVPPGAIEEQSAGIIMSGTQLTVQLRDADGTLIASGNVVAP